VAEREGKERDKEREIKSERVGERRRKEEWSIEGK
jgi:hypothetical protein